LTKKALVTITIGDEYKSYWDQHCKDNWEGYAEKHDYDIVLIEDYIESDPKDRAPNWQKLLLFDHSDLKDYDRVVWLDSDIVINYPQAPCIVSETQPGKVGCVNYQQALPSFEDRKSGYFRAQQLSENESLRKAAPITFRERYELVGLEDGPNDFINAGVLVLEPTHKQFLRKVYEDYDNRKHSFEENVWLSYELLKEDLIDPVDPRFNKLLVYELAQNYPFLFVEDELNLKFLTWIVNSVLLKSYFLHLTAGFQRRFIGLTMPGHSWLKTMKLIRENVPAETIKFRN
jgi:hypothetical protein